MQPRVPAPHPPPTPPIGRAWVSLGHMQGDWMTIPSPFPSQAPRRQVVRHMVPSYSTQRGNQGLLTGETVSPREKSHRYWHWEDSPQQYILADHLQWKSPVDYPQNQPLNQTFHIRLLVPCSHTWTDEEMSPLKENLWMGLKQREKKRTKTNQQEDG